MNEVSGEMSESITYLYIEIGLMDYAYTRLESERWHIAAKALLSLGVSEYLKHKTKF